MQQQKQSFRSSPSTSEEHLQYSHALLTRKFIVVGGGVSKAGQILIDGVAKYYREAAFIACKDTPIVLASLGNDAGIYGAAKMLID